MRSTLLLSARASSTIEGGPGTVAAAATSLVFAFFVFFAAAFLIRAFLSAALLARASSAVTGGLFLMSSCGGTFKQRMNQSLLNWPVTFCN